MPKDTKGHHSHIYKDGGTSGNPETRSRAEPVPSKRIKYCILCKLNYIVNFTLSLVYRFALPDNADVNALERAVQTYILAKAIQSAPICA